MSHPGSENGPSLAGTYFKLVMVALFWGGTFISTRVASQTFAPFTGAAIRYVIALIFLVPMAWKQNPGMFRVNRGQWPVLLLLGFSGIFAYNFFFFRGLKTIPASRGALLVALNPGLVMLFSGWVFREKITARKMLGLLISLIGVVIVISRGRPASLLSSLEAGDLFMLGCPVTWAIYTIAGRTALQHTTPLQASTWASLTGCAMLLLFSAGESFPPHVPVMVWVALAYLGIIGTVVAFVWYYEGVRKIGPTRTAIFTNLVPVFAVVLSVVVLGERVSAYTWAGGALVIGGILFSNLRAFK